MNLLNRVKSLELDAAEFGFCWETSEQIMKQILSECEEIQEHLTPLVVKKNAISALVPAVDESELRASASDLPESTLPDVRCLVKPGETMMTEAKNSNPLQEEIGDLLHAAFSLCVFCGFSPEITLNNTLDKFEKRLSLVKILAQQQGLQTLKGRSFDELMVFWDEAKILSDKVEAQVPTTDSDFQLDHRLEASCFHLIDWPLSRVLLKNNANFPWFILVPRRQGVTEIIQLSRTDRHQYIDEVNQLSLIVEELYRPDKLNVGELGNIVAQFHTHVVARFRNDSLWPQGIWQESLVEKTYVNPEALLARLVKLLR